MKEGNFMFKKILECFCLGNGGIEDNPIFKNLLADPHGPNRWVFINKLHALYDIPRDVIENLIKK